jgi:TolB-like protein
MKTLALLLLLAAGTALSAQQTTLTLDQAINNSVRYLAGRLPLGTTVVVLNFNAPTPELSGYIIEELTVYLVNTGRFTMVDRRNLEVLQEEIDFQLSGEVSDETVQSIGKKLGAETVISGSITALQDIYRMRVQAIQVETARVQSAQFHTVGSDPILNSLLPPEGSSYTVGRRIGAGALNLALGLGSYTMGDWKNGVILTSGYAAAAGLIIYELVGLSRDDDLAGVPGTIGIGVAGAAVVYGFVAPFIYQGRPGAGARVAQVAERINITVVPGARGIRTLGLTYTWHF